MSLIRQIFTLLEKKIQNAATGLEIKKLKAQISFKNKIMSIVLMLVGGVLGLFMLSSLSGASQTFFAELFGKPYYGYLTTALIYMLLIAGIFYMKKKYTS